jgi:hypothetical protein
MSLPTVNDVQAVDPVLTNMLRGYMQAEDRFIASRLFPPVSVPNDSGTYFIFTKKYWWLDELEQRAPGTEFARIDFGVSTATFATLQWAADAAVADEIRNNSQIPMDLEQAKVRLLAQRSLIRKEVAFAADFMVINVWGTDDNNATTDWDDFSAGDPIDDVLTARRTISNNTGVDGNTMAMGYIVHQALVNHPDILDRIKYTVGGLMGTVEAALASAFGVSNYWVAKGTYANINEAATFSATAIIDDDCLVCYVDPAPGIMTATAGLTFSWEGGGGMGSAYSYRDDTTHADVIQHKEQWDQASVATDVGHILRVHSKVCGPRIGLTSARIS